MTTVLLFLLRLLLVAVLVALLFAAAGVAIRFSPRGRCPRCQGERPTGGRHHTDRTDTTEGEPW